MKWLKRRRFRDDSGASAVEYGLLVTAIAALIVVVLFALGGIIGNLFDNSCGTIAGTITGATCAP
jgi:pilus assembly protein Flp/PilA